MRNRSDEVTPGPIAELVALLEAIPEVSAEVDRPADPLGEWWVDIACRADGCKDFQCNVAWRQKHGFGVFVSSRSYNAQPDEVYRSADLVTSRLEQLIRQWEKFSRLKPLSLAEMRQLRETPQTALAAVLEINQAAVSRFEHRDDMKLSSLESYVRAMGGRLELRVYFDGFDATLGISASDDICRPAQGELNDKA